MSTYVATQMVLFQCITATLSYDLKCPDESHWKLRATITCKNYENYTCVLHVLVNRFNETCSKPSSRPPGHKVVDRDHFDIKKCVHGRFQPKSFSTIGQSVCLFLKSNCSEYGQNILDNGTETTDRLCTCKHGFNFTMPNTDGYCKPDREDCSCYKKDNYTVENEDAQKIESNTSLVLHNGSSQFDGHSTFRLEHSRHTSTTIIQTSCIVVIILIIVPMMVFTTFCISDKALSVPDEALMQTRASSEEIIKQMCVSFLPLISDDQCAEDRQTLKDSVKYGDFSPTFNTINQKAKKQVSDADDSSVQRRKHINGESPCFPYATNENKYNKIETKNENQGSDILTINAEIHNNSQHRAAEYQAIPKLNDKNSFITQNDETILKQINIDNLEDKKHFKDAIINVSDVLKNETSVCVNEKTQTRGNVSTQDGIQIHSERSANDNTISLNAWKNAKTLDGNEVGTQTNEDDFEINPDQETKKTSRLPESETNYLKFEILIQKELPAKIRILFKKVFTKRTLISTINNNKDRLEHLYNNRYLSEEQRKSLFYRGNEFSSDNFEMKVMITLLRLKEKSMDLQCLPREDELPDPEDETFNADLSRFMYYRNKTQHCLDTKRHMTNDELKHNWKTIYRAVCRVCGPQAGEECKLLLLTRLDSP